MNANMYFILCLTQVTRTIHALPSYITFWPLLSNRLPSDKSLCFKYGLKYADSRKRFGAALGEQSG